MAPVAALQPYGHLNVERLLSAADVPRVVLGGTGLSTAGRLRASNAGGWPAVGNPALGYYSSYAAWKILL
jgi:thiamine monophosphate synthase